MWVNLENISSLTLTNMAICKFIMNNFFQANGIGAAAQRIINTKTLEFKVKIVNFVHTGWLLIGTTHIQC